MANPEHVAVVRQGAAAIAEWRAAHPDVRLDLRSANFAGAELAGGNLVEADLFAANLLGTNLAGADLISAHITGANLGRAKLAAADLTGANLIDANLAGANLLRANLLGVNLGGASLDRANLTEATLGETILASVALPTIRGLATVRHLGPSILDERTLRRSPDLPLEFLRGVGLSDELIALYRSWGRVINYYSSFISYAREDAVFVNRLYDSLQAKGVRSWLDSHDLPWGARMRPAVFDAIRVHDKTVIVLSAHSLASEWVEDEVNRAIAEERRTGRDKLFPVNLDGAVFEADEAWAQLVRDDRNIGDMTGWQDHARFEATFHTLHCKLF